MGSGVRRGGGRTEMPEKEPLRPSVGLGSELRPERVGVGGGGQREAVAFRATPGA